VSSLRSPRPDPFRALVEATDDGLLVVDADGVVLFSNPAARRMLGLTQDEIVRLPFGFPLTDEGGRAELDVVSPRGLLVAEMHVAPVHWQGAAACAVTLRDVTDRVLALRRLRRSDERYALTAAAANDGMWEWDSATGRVQTSARLHEMLGYEPDRTPDDAGWWEDLLHNDDGRKLAQALGDDEHGVPERISQEVRLRRSDGTWLWALVRGLVVRDDGRALRIVGSVTDISERKQAEEALRTLALHDALTGLANRALVLDHLQVAIEQARRAPDATFAVVFIDLDQFKLVNDSLGHPAGDSLLLEVGHRLSSSVRTTDTVGRLGGDEFVVVLSAPTDREHALATVGRIQQRLADPIRVGSELVYMTASMGVLLSGPEPDDAETVLQNADVAMYEAKQRGRDGFQIFTDRMQETTARRHALRTALRSAAAMGALTVHYQPVVTLRTGRIVGFEALLRWQRDEDVLDADEFVDTAEETGLLVSAGWDVLDAACRQVGLWRAAGYPVRVAVNLAAGQVAAPDLVERVRRSLGARGVDGSALQLELTERVAMSGLPGALEHLDECRALGVEVLVDDFGTGYSSLTALHDLPLTAIKIDKSFVGRLDGDVHEIVVAILALARSLGLGVVAEGIETLEQRDRLLALGCESGQGFLYAPAVDADEATRLLRAQDEVRP